MNEFYFAIDLGATSGRTLIARINNGVLECHEVNRFPNHIIQVMGHSYWDIYELYRNILEGLRLVAQRKDTKIKSIGIDTWGVDFVLLGKDGNLLRQPFSYRDSYTEGAPEKYFERVSSEMVYEKTGIQIMNFNTLFQLDTLRRNNDITLSMADKILFLPDAIGYMLTGEKVTEYTIATTAQLVNAKSRNLDKDLLHSIGLNETNFGRFVYPGDTVGILSEEIQSLTGLGPIPLISVAGHDTASAVAAVPTLTRNFAYLSSGTWSLMGVETSEPVINSEMEKLNFTNEGGVDHTIRLLKNICGMWLLEQCRLKWGNTSYTQLIEEASICEPFRSVINPDDSCFTNPKDMEKAIKQYCIAHKQLVPETRGQIVRCIFESLALRYREVLDMLCTLSPVNVEVIHVIGGGSRNDLLNQFTSNALGIPLIAGPSEATGLGNVMIQAIASGEAKNVAEMRRIIQCSVPLKTFYPQNREDWNKAYKYYKEITK